MIYQTKQQQRAQEQMEGLVTDIVAVLLIVAGLAGMIWIFAS